MGILVISFGNKVVLLLSSRLQRVKNMAESMKYRNATLTEINARCYLILILSKRTAVILSKTAFKSNW